MKPDPPSYGSGLFGRPILSVTIASAALVGIGLGGVAMASRGGNVGPPRWEQPLVVASPQASQQVEARKPASAGPPATITVSATGDVIMGSAPNRLPADNGAGFFDSVKSALKSDLVMGNLEQPLTDDTGTSKCGEPPRPNCYAFRSPPSYAGRLRDAGFELMNTANNHSRDFGSAGYRNTIAALRNAGLQSTGAEDQITVVPVKGVKVAVIGFSPYAGANNLNDLAHARAVVQRAKRQADLVIVQAHMGAEGSDKGHVRPGNELYFGENRGDPIAFSHAVIEAGADIVIGHGPHVLRGMEFYRGKLIVYSLGNFAGGGHTLSNSGVLKYGGVVRITITGDGKFVAGRFLSTYLNTAGVPTRDSGNERGRQLVASLSRADFGGTAARIGNDGSITPPG
jgi:poly-gamma-glutamate capsule biosynthesis protein CapA/YwtB (metallophosphatase superfamily)